MSFLSGWQDSNLRPPRPKRGAITGLRYTPKIGNLISDCKDRIKSILSKKKMQFIQMLIYKFFQ